MLVELGLASCDDVIELQVDSAGESRSFPDVAWERCDMWS